MSKKSDRPRPWSGPARDTRPSSKGDWLKAVVEDYPLPETSTQEREGMDPGLRLILGLAAAA